MSTCCPPRLIVATSDDNVPQLSLTVDETCWCDSIAASSFDAEPSSDSFTPSGKAVEGQTS